MKSVTPLLRSLALLIGAVAALPASAAAQAKHQCTYCHDLHGAGYSALNVRDVQVDLCQWCHDPDGGQGTTIDGKTIPKQGRNADPLTGFADHIGVRASDGWQPSCWSCHDHEGDADSTTTSTWVNLKMIAATIKDPANGARPVIFTQWSGDSSFADSNADSAFVGVCETCHTEAQRHRNTENFVSGYPAAERRHNADADCTGCHKHDSGFEGRGGGCAGCHAGGQSGEHVRRPVTPEFDRSTFHIDWVAAGGASSADIIDGDCLVCHVQEDGHPGEGSTGTGHNVALRNGNTGTTIVLTGNAATDGSNLTLFCLSCHQDGEDSTGDPNPFSDNVDIPVLEGGAVSTTFWANTSSHGQGQISCYGDGTGGCHVSHGSQKANLLAPGATAATSTFLNEQEEGFCLNCHDADGPSIYNIAAGFSQPIRWVPGVTGTTSNPDFNDRHDIQQDAQTRSGVSGFECTTCHNPHTATNAQPFVSDPDPGDGHVPAVGSLWNTTINGVNYQNSLVTGFCLDCHDNSFPAGLTGVGGAGHTITNIDSTWRYLYTAKKDDSKNDRMGIYNSNGGEGINDPILLWNGSQYNSIARPWAVGMVFNCEQCHSPHPGAKRNLFSLKDEVEHNGQTIVWTNGGADTVRNYSVTSWSVTDGVNNSGFFCNSCHDRDAMNSKGYCYDNCHIHGGSPGI